MTAVEDPLFERPGFDGFACREVFSDFRGYTYDDLILLPGHIHFSTTDVCLESKFSKNIPLKVPFISSPMDTVTGANMAINMALFGGNFLMFLFFSFVSKMA